MISIFYAIILFLMQQNVVPVPVVPCKCGISSSKEIPTRIINADRKHMSNPFPWMIRIFSKETIEKGDLKNSGLCAGAILNKRYAITAWHCFIWCGFQECVKNDKFGVLAVMDSNISDWCTLYERFKDGHVLEVEKLIFHDCSKVSPNNEYIADLALIRFKKELRFTSNQFTPVCLPHLMSPLINNTVVLAGWGNTNTEEGNPTCRIQSVSLSTLPRKHGNCVEAITEPSNTSCIDDFANSSRICAYAEDSNKKDEFGFNLVKDACQGDSGGPLMLKEFIPGGWTKRWTIVGIVSFGRSCAEINTAGVYTKITAYLRWIVSHIQDGICRPEDESNYAWKPEMGKLTPAIIHTKYKYLSVWKPATT